MATASTDYTTDVSRTTVAAVSTAMTSMDSNCMQYIYLVWVYFLFYVGAGYPSYYYPYILSILLDYVPTQCGGTGGSGANSAASPGLQDSLSLLSLLSQSNSPVSIAVQPTYSSGGGILPPSLIYPASYTTTARPSTNGLLASLTNLLGRRRRSDDKASRDKQKGKTSRVEKRRKARKLKRTSLGSKINTQNIGIVENNFNKGKVRMIAADKSLEDIEFPFDKTSGRLKKNFTEIVKKKQKSLRFPDYCERSRLGTKREQQDCARRASSIRARVQARRQKKKSNV